jgi:hypothetical protein
MEKEFKTNRLALIPVYLRGISNSKSDNRINYLKKTIDSIKDYFDIIIGVYDEIDQKTLLDEGIKTEIIKCDSPVQLGKALCEWALKNFNNERILFTEADHVFMSAYSWDYLDSIMNDDIYFSPHRLEQTFNGKGKNRGPNVVVNDINYVCPNSIQRPEVNENLINTLIPNEAYGGAYYCSHRALSKVEFKGIHLENAGGWDVFKALLCIKTSNILDFCINHLSGYEYNQTL